MEIPGLEFFEPEELSYLNTTHEKFYFIFFLFFSSFYFIERTLLVNNVKRKLLERTNDKSKYNFTQQLQLSDQQVQITING